MTLLPSQEGQTGLIRARLQAATQRVDNKTIRNTLQPDWIFLELTL